jgi:hypothetical protein
MTTPRDPNACSMVFNATLTAEASVVLTLKLRTFGSAWLGRFAAWTTSFATSSRSERARSAIAEAPDFANEITVALPIPFEAPVTRIFRPVAESLSGR